MSKDFTKVESVEHLLSILKEDPDTPCTFFVQLSFGLRSWKTLSLCSDDKKGILIWVYNEIDESEELTPIEDFSNEESIIGKAIKTGNFYFAWR